ncbi:MAG TPA: hypothetical protein VMH83_11265 [Candidatus Acidoferrum sp.]|nr:hypothetical protein [Candidatus Acidoferrum sp.]
MKLSATILCVGSLLLAGIANAQTPSPPCDRDCLKKHLDTYLGAIAAHKPEAGNLWVGFRQTENAIAIPEGQGAWQNVTGLGSIQRQYFDPVQHTAGYFGTVMMGQEEAVVGIRLKVQWDKATEAEWWISRKGDPGITGEPGKTPFDLEKLRASLPQQRVVAKEERMQREALPAIVNTYFDGITSHNSYLVKGHQGCSRYENGFPTFDSPMTKDMDLGNNGKTDCRTQGNFGVAIVTIRDYWLVDEEAQVVMMSGMFRRDPKNEKRRNALMELFHLDHGKIRSVHASFYYAPEDRPVPNWPPYDGLFPLPASYK